MEEALLRSVGEEQALWYFERQMNLLKRQQILGERKIFP